MSNLSEMELTIDAAIGILVTAGCHEYIYYNSWTRLDHCRRVSEYAREIASRISQRGIAINIHIAMLGGLLHDLAVPHVERGEILPIQHGYVAGQLLRNRGLVRLARIAECHIGSGITAQEIANNDLPLPHQNFLPQSIEEKVVTFADKIDALGYLDEDHGRLLKEVADVDSVWSRFIWLEKELNFLAHHPVRTITLAANPVSE